MDENRDEFHFVREQVKERKFWENKIFRRIIASVFSGVLFAAAALLVFMMAYPKLKDKYDHEEKVLINIPKDDPEEMTGQNEGDVVIPDESQTSTGQSVTPAVPIGNAGSQTVAGQNEGTASEGSETVPPEGFVLPEWELEAEDYAKLYSKLRQISREAQKYMTIVTAGNSDMDLFLAEIEEENQYSGLIIGNNGVEELILTTFDKIDGADRLRVTFADGKPYDAVLKKYDSITNLAVVSVVRSDLTVATMESIREVEWGSSRTAWAGQPVIAIGMPSGFSESVFYGNLTGTMTKASLLDGEVQLLMTDMNHNPGASGVLIDYDGKVVGWITGSDMPGGDFNNLIAYGISDVKEVIEHLCNNQDIAHLGVMVAQVTTVAEEELGLPKGIYIKDVELDSPAMEAGIQMGDVLTEISGQSVENIYQLQNVLMNFSADQTISLKVMRRGKEEMKEMELSATLRNY